jgi:hypothetical protein
MAWREEAEAWWKKMATSFGEEDVELAVRWVAFHRCP